MVIKAEKHIKVTFDENNKDKIYVIDLYTHCDLPIGKSRFNIKTLAQGDEHIVNILSCFEEEDIQKMHIIDYRNSGQHESDITIAVKHGNTAFAFETTVHSLLRALNIGYDTVSWTVHTVGAAYDEFTDEFRFIIHPDDAVANHQIVGIAEKEICINCPDQGGLEIHPLPWIVNY